MSYHMIPKGRIVIGNCGITDVRKAAGYFATICTEVTEPHPEGETHHFIDIHVTRVQLESLKSQIDLVLSAME